MIDDVVFFGEEEAVVVVEVRRDRTDQVGAAKTFWKGWGDGVWEIEDDGEGLERLVVEEM